MAESPRNMGPGSPQTPVVFVSYSWDDQDHKNWVSQDFTNGLRRRGVDAVVDVFQINYGDKLDEFMERTITLCDHVAVICTPTYADKALAETGGVGYEKTLIRRFMQTREEPPSHRVVPILRRGDKSSIPPFFGSRMWVDMRDDMQVPTLLDELAALFYGQQIIRAAPVAPPPPWLMTLLTSEASKLSQSQGTTPPTGV